MASFAHRLTCVAMAFALSGPPAVLAACMALCLDSPMAGASATGGTPAGHSGHGAINEPTAASPHAHHGTVASTLTAKMANESPLAPLDARLVGSCDSCCVDGPLAIAAGPGVERVDGRVFAMAPAVSVASFRLSAATHAAAPPSPRVPPPSPTRAPLALRI